MTFWEKYQTTTGRNSSYLCLGLDSDIELIPDHLQKEPSPIWAFNREIIAATQDKVAAYKLNFAFYLSAGLKGLEALQLSIAAIPESVPIIIDCKIGDISNTMKNYARAFFCELQADAVTVNPLMGSDVFAPLLEYQDKFFFSLVVTSNPSAEQYLKHNYLYREIARQIKELDYRQAGAVIGATNPEELAELRREMPETLFLIPGIGAQGGDLETVLKNSPSRNDDPRILINSSRGIIFKEKGYSFAEKAAEEAESLRVKINRYL
jgi:orotidine-5'-phosphate decarboxylase